MKKFAASICLLLGFVSIAGAGFVSVEKALPGVGAEAFNVVAGLQGQCQYYAGAACKYGPTSPCEFKWSGYFVGTCTGAGHDNLDSSEAGMATMLDDDCCRLTEYCYSPSIWETHVGTPPAGVVAPTVKIRNKCVQQ